MSDLIKQDTKKDNTSRNVAGLVAAIALAGLPAVSQAAEITAMGQGLSQEVDGAKSIVIALFAAGAIILGIFAGYRYLKRGANNA